MDGILALDPPGPIFEANSEITRLGPNDAKAVQVFHTDAGGAGYYPPCGTVDFYFNGGRKQPGCSDLDDIISGNVIGCSHFYGRNFLTALNQRVSTGFRFQLFGTINDFVKQIASN